MKYKEYELVTKQVDSYFKLYQDSLSKRDGKKDDLNSLKIDLERKDSDKKLVLQKIENFIKTLFESCKACSTKWNCLLDLESNPYGINKF